MSPDIFLRMLQRLLKTQAVLIKDTSKEHERERTYHFLRSGGDPDVRVHEECTQAFHRERAAVHGQREMVNALVWMETECNEYY